MRTNNVTDAMQEATNQRIWQFIDRVGGAATVAGRLGVAPQTLYNIRDNRAFPSSATLALLKKHYPQTNLNAFLGEDENLPLTITEGMSEYQAGRINQLEVEIEALRHENDRVRAYLLEQAHPELFRDKEGIKIGSDSPFTEYHPTPFMRPQIGFRISVGRG